MGITPRRPPASRRPPQVEGTIVFLFSSAWVYVLSMLYAIRLSWADLISCLFYSLYA